ncbi:hypothetical protein B5V00_03790 [Geothermobacter hydrogeniphilus]|uniref:PilZ domain-containing protein n=2 Tax=Geothermobacter hydrogeniphilus TaxID=1969733 RepID=A0A1X0YBB9_9BACT|nr:hypothetical protein B5V00_03790 [Geothermobacter hydrogeniphilus]
MMVTPPSRSTTTATTVTKCNRRAEQQRFEGGLSAPFFMDSPNRRGYADNFLFTLRFRLMPYRKYFKTDQRLLLRPISGEQNTDRVETLTAFIVHARGDSCDLRLPYENRPGEEFPFTAGMEVELSGEALGLGVRITGRFERYLDPGQLRISIDPTLEVFQRRNHPRRDVRVGLRYTRGHGTLRTFRRQWEKNIRILAGRTDLKKLGGFPRCQVNLSQGGLRFTIRPPVEVADLCMILLELEPQSPPVCALAEVVWISDPGEEPNQHGLDVGMQFIDILKSDQKRIADFMSHATGQASSPAEVSGS